MGGFDFSGMTGAPKAMTTKQMLITRACQGQVVPIVSHEFAAGLAFVNYQGLLQQWATEIGYPNPDEELAQMAQRENIRRAQDGHSINEVATKEQYLSFLKRALFFVARYRQEISAPRLADLKSRSGLSVSDLAWHLNIPTRRSRRDNPLLMLADLPLPIFVTTSPHQFLEAALRAVKKEPKSDLCRWHKGLLSIPSPLAAQELYEPDVDHPLVFHLHGRDDYPHSLVLTEDDYLDFLYNISTTDERVIHPRISQALTESALMLLGYRLAAWEFKVLFRGIIRPRPQTTPTNNIAIQLVETPFEKEYVHKYMQQARFEIEWENAPTFINDIHAGCEV